MDGAAYIIFIILVGMLGGTAVTMFLPKLNRNNVGDVECTRLAIVDPDDGKTRIVLGSTDDGGLIQVFDKNEKYRIEAGISDADPMVKLFDTDGSTKISLSCHNECVGLIRISGKNEKGSVHLGAFDENVGLIVTGIDGESQAAIT